MKDKGHLIFGVLKDSIAWNLDIEPGDKLLSINDHEIIDVLDYHYGISDSNLVILIEKKNGMQWEIDIEKDIEEDLGIVFEEGLMDSYRSCTNKCIFCFIDQMPPDMRETLYFKDDDARLSFLQGNYITLTNLSDEDVERIIYYKLSPINISVHTTNKELRSKMLNNRFAGEALDKLQTLYDNNIIMNGQIVLCKGINDAKELEKTIEDLAEYIPLMRSLSVVPVGITKYREGLASLENFDAKDSKEVIDIINYWQEKCLKDKKTRFVYASDEWYLKAGLTLPGEEEYEGYLQIENGVGMTRSFIEEFKEELHSNKTNPTQKAISLVTGKLAGPIIKELIKQINEVYPNIHVNVYIIENEFFGTDITVTGLITGQDIIKQLEDKDLGEVLLLPSVILKHGEDVMLDDLSIADIEEALQTEVTIVNDDGKSFLKAIIDERRGKYNE
ncbi:MAG TPA: DUF512 domain-containing protein [Clostridiales bacterium]|nr:DUF512 domain-containing protein [Clostridiales bacterium]